MVRHGTDEAPHLARVEVRAGERQVAADAPGPPRERSGDAGGERAHGGHAALVGQGAHGRQRAAQGGVDGPVGQLVPPARHPTPPFERAG